MIADLSDYADLILIKRKREMANGKGDGPIIFTPVKDSKMAKYQELVEWAQKQMAQPTAIIPEDDEHQLEIIEAETNN